MRLVPSGYAAEGRQYSLLEYLLWETEQMHGRIRRYTSPDEHAFFPRELPPLVLPPIQYPEVDSLSPLLRLSSSSECPLKRLAKQLRGCEWGVRMVCADDQESYHTLLNS